MKEPWNNILGLGFCESIDVGNILAPGCRQFWWRDKRAGPPCPVYTTGSNPNHVSDDGCGNWVTWRHGKAIKSEQNFPSGLRFCRRVTKGQATNPVRLRNSLSLRIKTDIVVIFEQYIPVVFINNLKYKCIYGYIVSSGVNYTSSDMFRPFHNGHLQASIIGVVNTIVIRIIRDLVSCDKLALYYHILVGGVVVK
jgi:hypothetical protein